MYGGEPLLRCSLISLGFSGISASYPRSHLRVAPAMPGRSKGGRSTQAAIRPGASRTSRRLAGWQGGIEAGKETLGLLVTPTCHRVEFPGAGYWVAWATA